MRQLAVTLSMVMALLLMGCATTRTVTRTVTGNTTTVDSTVTKSVLLPSASVDVGYHGGIRIGSSFRRQAVQSFRAYGGPRLIWHTFAGGVEPSPRYVTMTSRTNCARFTLVANCHPSRVVVYRDGIEFRTVRGRGWAFEVPNDFDNAVRTYTIEVMCEGDDLPWSWDFDVESSAPRMRGSYP